MRVSAIYMSYKIVPGGNPETENGSENCVPTLQLSRSTRKWERSRCPKPDPVRYTAGIGYVFQIRRRSVGRVAPYASTVSRFECKL